MKANIIFYIWINALSICDKLIQHELLHGLSKYFLHILIDDLPVRQWPIGKVKIYYLRLYQLSDKQSLNLNYRFIFS